MSHLDYISCFLTIAATVLVGRKSWLGLLLSIVNSLIVCVIGFRTSQFGFIPANLFCICVYGFSIRSWIRKTPAPAVSGTPELSGLRPWPWRWSPFQHPDRPCQSYCLDPPGILGSLAIFNVADKAVPFDTALNSR